MSDSHHVPKAPKGLNPAGRALWRAVTGDYELQQHEAALLCEACRTVDLLDALAGIVEVEGPMLDGRVHPAVVEARELKITLARLTAALRLPEGDGDGGERRPQRRQGARGVYGLVS